MNPWRNYLNDLKYIENKYSDFENSVDVYPGEYEAFAKHNDREQKRQNGIVNFSRWVHGESQNQTNSQSLLSESIEFENERDIRKQPHRSVKCKQPRYDGSESPLVIDQTELQNWFQPASDDQLEDTMANGRGDDLFERINKLERHICELVQLNRALIVSGARDEGIPMPELVWNNEKENDDMQDPPWKRRHSKGVRLKIPLSVQDERSYTNLKFVPCTPVKDEGILSRDENGIYFSPRVNPDKKYMVYDAYPEYSSIHPEKSTTLYKSVINGQTPKKLLFK